MKVQPFGNQVLVRKHECSKSDHYGVTHLIEVPEDFRKEIKHYGQVLAVGKDVIEDINPGDHVLLNAYRDCLWQTNAKEDGELAFVTEDDIYAVISQKPQYLALVPEEARQYDEVA